MSIVCFGPMCRRVEQDLNSSTVFRATGGGLDLGFLETEVILREVL